MFSVSPKLPLRLCSPRFQTFVTLKSMSLFPCSLNPLRGSIHISMISWGRHIHLHVSAKSCTGLDWLQSFCFFIYWRQQETPHQKCCITFYMNILHMRKGGLSSFLFESHLMTYWKYGSVFKIFQNWAGPTILKDAPCAHDTSVFAMKFRKSLWKLFYKQETIKKLKRNKNGKHQE